MKSVEYSQLVKRKLLKLKKELAGEFRCNVYLEGLSEGDYVEAMGDNEKPGE